uniref:Prolactin receptor n=1 Tax=Oryzias latipes TaxID=8090 RepID=A0A3P9M839_ORYLA
MLWKECKSCLFILHSFINVCFNASPPGKPALIGCRSPDKETFTCWWTPGSPGGLPTVHRLYYHRAESKVVRECPDYTSGGSNSCYFDKSQTTLWVEYELTVVATNALGNATSDTLSIDVMNVVRPYPPKNVILQVKQSNDNPYLFIGWQSPLNKTKTYGWVTIKYQLRVRPEKSKEWKIYDTDLQRNFSLHTVDPRVTYEVEVRCALDHSTWSEWSPTASIKIPGSSQKDRLLWVLMLVSLIPLLTAVCALVVKRNSVKQCLLPPVPGPKIIGVDPRLLKSGRAEDVVSALFGNQKLANMKARTEEMEEFISVSDSRDWLLPDERLSEKVRSLIIPNGFVFGAKTQSFELEKAADGKEDPVLDRSSSRPGDGRTPLPPAPELKSLSASKDVASRSAGQCPAHSYVDIPTPEECRTPEATQDDYSRVKGVHGEDVLLEEERVPPCPDAQIQLANMASDYSRVAEVNSDATVLLQNLPVCKERQHHDAGWTVGKKPEPPGTEVSTGSSTQLVGSGYVDSVPNFC